VAIGFCGWPCAVNLARWRPRGGDRRQSAVRRRSTSNLGVESLNAYQARRQPAGPPAGLGGKPAASPFRFVPLDIAQNYEGLLEFAAPRSGPKRCAFRRGSAPRLLDEIPAPPSAITVDNQRNGTHNLLWRQSSESGAWMCTLSTSGTMGVRLRLPPGRHDSAEG